MSLLHLRNVGGFFSDYYLGAVLEGRASRSALPRLPDRERDALYRRFRNALERGRATELRDRAAARERIVRPILRDVLGWHLGAEADGIHGLWSSAQAEADGQRPLALAVMAVDGDELDRGHGVLRRRLEDALARAEVARGFLVSPDRIRLLGRPGERARGACFEVDLAALAEEEQPEAFGAFVRLFRVAAFAPAPDGAVPITELERESRRQGQKVSEDLKRAVFAATEALVDGLLEDVRSREAAADESSAPHPDAEVSRFRDAGLLALYRLLFILYAESRDDRLADHPLYRASYSVSGLLDDVIAVPLEEWPENRDALWSRLLATFRIFDEGLPAISPWENLPPRGSDFFSAKTPPGRLLAESRLSDRIVARLLLELAMTAPRKGVGRERISFRELDVEQLGAVYEGLLEWEPRVAKEPLFDLRIGGRPFLLDAAELVRMCEAKRLEIRGERELLAGTIAERLHADALAEAEAAADEEADDADDEEEDEGETDGEEGDEGESEGVKKGAPARLLRRIEPGRFAFVPGGARKGSGSYYTPPPLVKDLVRHALGPLVDGRKPAEIERLRVLDPACGSAHFLVEAMRFLGQALHRAWVKELAGSAPPEFRATGKVGWDADGEASDAAARAANSEARAWCKRRIAERCLFGVDLNPTAVELARVALWIESVAGDRPLSYFEHHVRRGNSLLGSWLDRLRHPPLPELGEAPPLSQVDFIVDQVRAKLREAARLRRWIDEVDAESLRREGVEPESVQVGEMKERRRREIDDLLAAARLLFDLRAAAIFIPEIWGQFATFGSAFNAFAKGTLEELMRRQPWWGAFEKLRGRAGEGFFHWELEFPEVFLAEENPGFDAVLGNPPWDKVLPSKHEFYARADVLIRAFKGNELERRIAELHAAHPGLAAEYARYRERTNRIAAYLRQGGDFPLSESRGHAAHEDVVKYLLDRAARVVRRGGRVGMVVPSVVYNGDACVGLRRFLLEEAAIERFYGFENKGRHAFPIHASYKFVNLVFRKGEPCERFEAAFMRHDMDELEAIGEKPYVVSLSAAEIREVSPETLAFLEYRSRRDQAIVAKMQIGLPALGGNGEGAWGTRLVTWRDHTCTYNTTEDKDLFTQPGTGAWWSPFAVLRHVPAGHNELVDTMRDHGFVPVFEGKQVDQFMVGIKPIRWWLNLEQSTRKYGSKPMTDQLLAYRRAARNTDQRTMIAAALPMHSAGSDTLIVARLATVPIDGALSVFNSLAFDYLVRMRVAGADVRNTYLLPIPVPPADVVNRLPTLPTQLAWERGIKHITELKDLWPTLWDINRKVAEAYGLDPDDFAHILGSFPVFARKRKEFFAYLLSRLAEWSAEVGVPVSVPGLPRTADGLAPTFPRGGDVSSV